MIGPWERSLAGPNRTGIVFAARDDGEGDTGRLPPVVSSLFSIRAAHFKRWYQRHGAVSKGQGADGATAPRYRLSDVQATRLPLQAPGYYRSAEFQQEGEFNG